MNYLCVNLRRWFNRRHAHKGNRVKCKQKDHHTTKPRKERHHPPSSVDDKSSLLQQLGESDLVFGMQSLLVIRTVKFDERITVYELNDWPADVYLEARRGQWMQHAVDRCRFKRRIKQTEIELGNIFSDDHRKKIVCRLYQ
jgi:hypothetical protein